MSVDNPSSLLVIFLASLLLPAQLSAEEELDTIPELPAVEEDQASEPLVDLDINAEYRVRSLQITPVELNGTAVGDIGWTEQRARFDASANLKGIIAINTQFDALGGVLFGDNGRFMGNPSANSGVSLATKNPNITKWEIGLLPGGDPLNRQDYGPVLVEADLLKLNFLYADAMLPIGLLRVGRQPLNYGATITAHEGGRYNRWGVSQYVDAADRILFGTKLDEIVKTIAKGDEHTPNTSMDDGVIMGLYYDFHRQNDISTFHDDLRQMGINLQWLVSSPEWFGLDWSDFRLSATVNHLRNEQFNSRIFAFPVQFQTSVENLDLNFQVSHLRGQSEEISVGFGALTGDAPRLQDFNALGAHGRIDLHLGRFMLTLESNYASGGVASRVTDPITSFNFSRDFNVGLLLFEHIMAFESARSVAVGIENLSGLDMESFPLTEVRTDGRFNNAIGLFPQLYVDLLKTPNHNLFARAGVLAAWSASKYGVVDPIQTALNDAGGPVEDNAINFHGGVPDRYYGTEFDLQLGYRLKDNFYWTIEGAALLPGPALYDQHGDAVRSFLVENRFEFIF